MQVTYPAYYDQFRCTASACPDSCCKEWAVAVDEASAAFYRQLPGDLGDDLRAAMQEEDGDIILVLTADGRCPMWLDNGLCRIQAELGEKALCHTCTQFPRLYHDYGSFAERGLELSCPEAARLILNAPAKPSVQKEEPGGEEQDYDEADMAVLLQSRATALSLLSDARYTPGQALAILLLYGCDAQTQLEVGEPAVLDPEQELRRAESLARQGDAEAFLEVFRQLNILTPQWKVKLNTPQPGPWQEPHRAMARYLVERYWLQAVSDLDLFCRVKFMAASCLAVKLLGGDVYETAQQYSKEIENDADNVDALLDAAYTCPAFADVKLLHLLLM